MINGQKSNSDNTNTIINYTFFKQELKEDLSKILDVFELSMNLGLEKLCFMFDDEGEKRIRSRARSILHALFFTAYLTSLTLPGETEPKSYYKAYGNVNTHCNNHPCQYVIGFFFYRYIAESLCLVDTDKSDEHFVLRQIGTGQGQIAPGCSGCGYYHTMNEIVQTKDIVYECLGEIYLEKGHDSFTNVPVRINSFINKNNFFQIIGSRANDLYEIGGVRRKIRINLPAFDDFAIFFPKPELSSAILDLIEKPRALVSRDQSRVPNIQDHGSFPGITTYDNEDSLAKLDPSIVSIGLVQKRVPVANFLSKIDKDFGDEAK
jgi:hypothetical protein